MKQVCFVSGKGGTGKSSLSASFAYLSKTPIVMADCDVDGANLALFLKVKNTLKRPFTSGTYATINTDQCNGCTACIEVCRFGAISVVENKFIVTKRKCEGCHACSIVCPSEAITFLPNSCGETYISETNIGTLVHARLNPASDNSGKLVTTVRKEAQTFATKDRCELIIIDGPPGVACPAIAALNGVDLAVVVTEPSISGVHDLKRILDLCAMIKVPATVLINKYDLSKELSKAIETTCAEKCVTIIGRVPFDKEIPMALSDLIPPSQLKKHTENLMSIREQIFNFIK